MESADDQLIRKCQQLVKSNLPMINPKQLNTVLRQAHSYQLASNQFVAANINIILQIIIQKQKEANWQHPVKLILSSQGNMQETTSSAVRFVDSWSISWGVIYKC